MSVSSAPPVSYVTDGWILLEGIARDAQAMALSNMDPSSSGVVTVDDVLAAAASYELPDLETEVQGTVGVRFSGAATGWVCIVGNTEMADTVASDVPCDDATDVITARTAPGLFAAAAAKANALAADDGSRPTDIDDVLRAWSYLSSRVAPGVGPLDLGPSSPLGYGSDEVYGLELSVGGEYGWVCLSDGVASYEPAGCPQ